MLVRPDGHVAWRSNALADDPAAELGEAMEQILGLGAARSHSADARVVAAS